MSDDPFDLPAPDPVPYLRIWVDIWRGHNGRLMPDVDMPTIAAAADELESLRARVAELEPIKQRAREMYGVVTDGSALTPARAYDRGIYVAAGYILGEA